MSRIFVTVKLGELPVGFALNHNEIDHSGALPELLREIPDVPIYCTARGEAILRGHYHGDWNFKNILA